VSSQDEIDTAAALLTTLVFGTDVSIQKTGKAAVTATYDIANDTGGPLTVNLVLARYNDRGQLLSVARKGMDIQEALRVEKIVMDMPEGSSGTVKAYIWGASLRPLCSDATHVLA
jgi:hypothetical protein